MKLVPDNKWFLILLRIAIGGIFIYAGSLKVSAPQAFADSIASFQFLPVYLINLLALSLPIFEIIAGALLVIGWQKKVASFSIILLTLVFAIALAQGLARGLVIDCGCFGGGKPLAMKTWESLTRDMALLVATSLVYFKAARKPYFAAP